MKTKNWRGGERQRGWKYIKVAVCIEIPFRSPIQTATFAFNKNESGKLSNIKLPFAELVGSKILQTIGAVSSLGINIRQGLTDVCCPRI